MKLYSMEKIKETVIEMSELDVHVTLTAPQGWMPDQEQLQKLALIMTESGQQYINSIFSPHIIASSTNHH